ncbi:juvenile hormone esterase isoform X2 [Agrilus planipennis]|nr:juvenile hormone esterase isoform X2 [Agrilus planipennis]
MVWIHGGAFCVGSGHSDECGPDYLITKGVIIVTLNYRLGVFGFLRVDEPSVGIPGNAGMKDMVMGLRWVKENISKFGGDPNNITIFGVSAGGCAVHFLTLSPLAKGLFNQAIVQSGSALSFWSLIPPDVKPLHELAKALGIQNQDEKAIVHEIEKLSAEELLQPQLQMFAFGGPMMFAPTIEKPSKEPAFLLDHPINIIKSGKFNQVPTIFGYTSREGMLLALPGSKFIKDYEDFVPFNLGFTKGSSKSKEIGVKIGQYFYGGKEPSTENIDIAFTIYTDTCFLNGIYEAIKESIKVSPENIYLYRFSLEGRITFVKSMLRLTLPGVCHGDDVPYMLRLAAVPLQINPNSLEGIAIERYTTLLTNFAKYGNPNPKQESDLINVEWKPVQRDQFNFLEFGENLTVGVNPDWRRIKFWEEALKL